MSGQATRENKGVGAVRGMFMFALLAVFALLSLIVVLVGARVYRAVEQRGGAAYESRTVLSYIAGKVRSMDAAGRISTASLDGAEALALGAAYGGEEYATYIYVHDGQLMEYFGRADLAFSPAYGEAIAAAAGFRASIDGQLLTLDITMENGESESLRLYLQCGEVGA